MRKYSLGKISLLGLALTTVSVVTAAILPSNLADDRSKNFSPGSLTKNSGPGSGVVSSITCEPDTLNVQNVCNVTVEDCIQSETSENGGLCNSGSMSSENMDCGIGEDNTTDRL